MIDRGYNVRSNQVITHLKNVNGEPKPVPMKVDVNQVGNFQSQIELPITKLCFGIVSVNCLIDTEANNII